MLLRVLRHQGARGRHPRGLIPHEAAIRLNVPVLLFSLGIAVVTSIVFGLVPALQAARPDLVEPLRDAGKGLGGGSRRGRLPARWWWRRSRSRWCCWPAPAC